MTLTRRIIISISIVLPVLLVSVYSYIQIRKNTIERIYEERRSLVSLSAHVLKEKLDRLNDVGLSFSTRPALCQYVDEQKWNAAIALMKQVSKDFPYIDHILLVDTAGTIMADVPFSPGVIGESYAQVDWYKALRKNWQPYLSEVYVRAENTVAMLAHPVKNNAGKVRGILALRVKVAELLEWSKEVSIGSSGFLYVVDHKGRIAANPEYARTDSVIDYSSVPAVQKALKGEKNVEVLYNPIVKENRLSAYEQIPGYGWAVIVQQEASAALSANNSLQLVFVLYAAITLLAVIFAYFITREMNRRAKAEEVLRQKTEELDRYFTHTLDLLCIADMQGYFRRLNKAWESTLGYTLQDLEGKPFLDFVHPDDIKATLDAMSDLGAGKEVLSFTNRYRRKDGSYRLIEWRSFPAGKLIYASARDITESKQLEDRFRLVVESAPNAIILVDSKGTIRLVNAQTEHYFGFNRDELLGKKIEVLVPRENAIDHTTLRSSYFSHPDTRSMGKGRDLFGLRKDGSKIPIEVGLSPIHFEEEMLVLASIIDITERKRAEENIRQANEQLAVANKELEAFSYSVSHDLRAPLRHMSGFADLLHRHSAGTLDDKGKRYLATITDATKGMGTLIDDLLSFSRMGRTEMHRTRINMKLLVEEVVRGMESETQGRTIEWHIEQLPEVNGDLSMLRQVFVNLLSNAFKYARTRETAKIHIGAEEKNDEHIFFVRDNGVGFDMQYKDKLFGVFQRLHSLKDYEGTGIGLANVRRIIARHKGETWAESELNNGATFYFSIPTNQKGSL